MTASLLPNVVSGTKVPGWEDEAGLTNPGGMAMVVSSAEAVRDSLIVSEATAGLPGIRPSEIAKNRRERRRARAEDPTRDPSVRSCSRLVYPWAALKPIRRRVSFRLPEGGLG